MPEVHTDDRPWPWESGWCRLTFTPGRIDAARILVADARLTPTDPLLMDARPA